MYRYRDKGIVVFDNNVTINGKGNLMGSKYSHSIIISSTKPDIKFILKKHPNFDM